MSPIPHRRSQSQNAVGMRLRHERPPFPQLIPASDVGSDSVWDRKRQPEGPDRLADMTEAVQYANDLGFSVDTTDIEKMASLLDLSELCCVRFLVAEMPDEEKEQNGKVYHLHAHCVLYHPIPTNPNQPLFKTRAFVMYAVKMKCLRVVENWFSKGLRWSGGWGSVLGERVTIAVACRLFSPVPAFSTSFVFITTGIASPYISHLLQV